MVNITIKDLARALLYCSADKQGGRTMESVLRCLNVDLKDSEKVELAKQRIRTLKPGIDDWLVGTVTSVSGCKFAKGKNPYPPGTILYHLWETMKHGNWRDRGTIEAGMMACRVSCNLQDIHEAIKIASDPWHPQNGGRSFIRRTPGLGGTILSRMEFSIPKDFYDFCRQTLGAMPPPPKVGPVDPPLRHGPQIIGI